MCDLKKNSNYLGSAHPKSGELTRWAQNRLKKLFPNGKPRFGDKRDLFLKNTGQDTDIPNPCTSKGLSTMPRRAA